jgi:hypothetical protein
MSLSRFKQRGYINYLKQYTSVNHSYAKLGEVQFLDDIDIILGKSHEIEIPPIPSKLGIEAGNAKIVFLLFTEEERYEAETKWMLYGDNAPLYMLNYRMIISFWARYGDVLCSQEPKRTEWTEFTTEIIGKVKNYYAMQCHGSVANGRVFFLSARILDAIVSAFAKKYPEDNLRLKRVYDFDLQQNMSAQYADLTSRITKDKRSDKAFRRRGF